VHRLYSCISFVPFITLSVALNESFLLYNHYADNCGKIQVKVCKFNRVHFLKFLFSFFCFKDFINTYGRSCNMIVILFQCKAFVVETLIIFAK